MGERATESDALCDVLAERQRQIAKGYTAEHDDEHTPVRIMSYGGLIWHLPLYGPINAAKSRATMVRMAACLLAAIERIDRGGYLDSPPARPPCHVDRRECCTCCGWGTSGGYFCCGTPPGQVDPS